MHSEKDMDYGPHPYVGNISWEAWKNPNYRRAYWTGEHLQVTLMSIPARQNIGWEMHENVDQLLRLEQGQGLVQMGNGKDEIQFQQYVGPGDMVFVPAGTWHDVWNMGEESLKLSSVYAPPNHKRGTLEENKSSETETE